MSVFAIAARRLSLNAARDRLILAAVAMLIAAVAMALAATLIPARGQANVSTTIVPISSAAEAALVEATTGDSATSVTAIGDQAKLINAALPFASAPIQAARPFAAPTSDVEGGRALLCLTQAVYYEAGFEPLQGRRAVAQVVLNRARHPAFPKSICGVVYQNNGRICQFTFVCDGALARAPAAMSWRQARDIAQAALGGYVETSVGAATHYHADYVAPRWAPLLAKIAKLGQHVFYRWPGSWGQQGAFNGRYIGEPRDPLGMRPAIRQMAVEGIPTEATTIAVAGPVVARAANDVGGLLDTSKGWTLSIPGPEESSSAASRLAASQQAKPSAASAAGATAIAAR